MPSVRPWPRPWSPTVPGRCRHGQDPVLVHRIAWLIQVGARLAALHPLGDLSPIRPPPRFATRIEQLLGMSPQGLCGRHLPRPGPPPFAGALAGSGAVAEFPDPRQRRPAIAIVKRVIRAAGPRRAALAGTPGAVVSQRQKDEGLRPQHIQPPAISSSHHAQHLRSLQAGLRAAPGDRLLRAAAAAPWICGATIPACWNTTSGASSTCWWNEFQDTNAVQYACSSTSRRMAPASCGGRR